MGDANVAALQNAANRYAQIASFSPIAVDGIMGFNTETAVLRALQEISQDVDGEGDNATQLIATLDRNQMAASAIGLTDYLNNNADYLNLPAAAPVVASGGGGRAGGGSSHPAFNPVNAGGGFPMAANLQMMWANLPMTVKVGGGIILGALAIFAGSKLVKQRRVAA
jgi:hypothetical protein